MVKNFAHRGFSGLYPENTMIAFQKAVECEGCDGIELDVQLTRDRIPVVFHDETLERVCGVKGKVRDYTLEELSHFSLYTSGEHIPTFEDVLKLVDGKVPLIIEMKVEYFDLRVCRAADQLLQKYKGVYCIESFNPLLRNNLTQKLPCLFLNQNICIYKSIA